MSDTMKPVPNFFVQQHAVAAMHNRLHESIEENFSTEVGRMQAGDQPKYEISIDCDCGKSWSYKP